MTRPARTFGALLAAGALLLGGCDVVTTTDETGQSQPTQQESRTEGRTEGSAGSEGGGAPGDLLPSTTSGADDAEPADPPTTPEPAEDSGEEPELGGPGIPACDLLDLPATALDTIEDIEAGGPYEFPRNDGVTFQNREGILPDKSQDYYREFTVVTPNLDHRGARRIVTGGGAEIDPDHWYFTGDHYESFCEFDPDRG